MEKVAFFFHILGVMLFVAGVVVAGTASRRARRRQRPSEIASLLGLTRVGVVLVVAGTVLAGVFGLWLVHLGRWGYGTGWVNASIVLFVVVIALGAVGGRRPKQARLLASRLAEQDTGSNGGLPALLDDRISRAENYLSLLLVLVIVALMVFKP